MGNIHCPAEDTAYLAAVTRDFCPFPEYSFSPLFANMLSVNSSRHLSEHYTAVQAGLTPQQQQAFTQTLRSTFGRDGKVSYGGVGVVALSLFILFDTVAREVKGEYISNQEPIPGLFLKDPRGYYAPRVYTISRYLRLVPHIANNPSRMKEETARHLRELNAAPPLADTDPTAPRNEDITKVNMWLCHLLQKSMKVHLSRISNKKSDIVTVKPRETPASDFTFNLNCAPQEAGERFRDELDTFSDRFKEAFWKCRPDRDAYMLKTVMKNIAVMSFVDTTMLPVDMSRSQFRLMYSQTKDFDLKAHARGKWNKDL